MKEWLLLDAAPTAGRARADVHTESQNQTHFSWNVRLQTMGTSIRRYICVSAIFMKSGSMVTAVVNSQRENGELRSKWVQHCHSGRQ